MRFHMQVFKSLFLNSLQIVLKYHPRNNKNPINRNSSDNGSHGFT